MKTNYQNDIVVCFDLHDTLLDSNSAWKKAFKVVCKDRKIRNKIIREYKKGGWKRKICQKYNCDYDTVKDIYLTFVKPIKNVKKFCLEMKKRHATFVITNARRPRALEDIKILGVDFKMVYTRDDGVKPDKEYIQRILTENNIKSIIMVGNEKEKDIFDLKNSQSIIVHRFITYKSLMRKYKKCLNKLQED